MITRTPDGKLLWLEEGNAGSGLQHILDGKTDDFARRGIAENEIVDFLDEILQTKPIEVGTTSAGPYAIYSINGKQYAVAYGSNGYIVSFYPYAPK